MLPPSSAIATVFRQTLAFAAKDLNQQLRFKIGFVADTFVPALVNLALFSTVFFGFFVHGSASGSELGPQNYAVFAILGALSSTLFNNSYQAFRNRFQAEKYWQTTLSLLASPLSPWALLFGVSLSETVRFSAVAIVFLVASYALFPVHILPLMGVMLFLVLLYIIVSGFSLIRGVLFLVNENIDPVLTYFTIGTAYLSCFYYPAEFLPTFLRPLAQVNPLFFAVDSIRTLWFGAGLDLTYLGIVILTAAVSPIVGTYLFTKVWRNLDMTGY